MWFRVVDKFCLSSLLSNFIATYEPKSGFTGLLEIDGAMPAEEADRAEL